MARFLPDAADLHSFALRAKAELPGSIEMLLMLARSYTDAVLAGHNKTTLPAPEAPAPTVQTQPAPTAHVFTVRDVAIDGIHRESSPPLPQHQVSVRREVIHM
jgi:hypothetical protein